MKPPFACLDTLQIEADRRRRREQPAQPGELQLGRLRRAYGLPAYTAHNALTDALATAELFLAIAAKMEPAEPLKLGPHVRFV